MDNRKIPWKAEWKAAGLDPGPLSSEEQALVPRLEAENQAFLIRHPPKSVLRPRRRPLVFAGWALPLAAAAVLAVVALPLAQNSTAIAGLERIKGPGEPVLSVYRQGVRGAEKLAPGAAVHPGDVLQASYAVSQPLQGALVSVDGSGNVTVHLASQGASVALVAGGERFLEFSYELDRAPRFEVFLLLTSSRPFELEPVRQILKRTAWNALAPGAFGPGVTFTVLPLVKEVTR